ncbi:MAG: tetratricopeptide repeat protein [Sphingopyxis sp.]
MSKIEHSDDDGVGMTEETAGNGRWLLLGLGCVALIGALGFALSRSAGQSDDTAAAAPAAPVGAGIAALEARTVAEPENGEAWANLAQARFDSEDYAGAVAAYRKATSLSPAVAGLWSGLGEALVMAAPRVGPPIPADAMAAFERAVGLDADDPRARYFIAAKRDVDGDHAGAITAWLALLADTPQGAPWEADLRRTIQQVGERNNIDVASRLAAVRQPQLTAEQLPVAARAIPGPTRGQMQQAAALPKGQQDMMVQGMVDSLQAKLDANPAQPDRWIMLMRSRMTLGQSAQAGEALRRAVAANPGQEARLRAQARMLGVPGAL